MTQENKPVNWYALVTRDEVEAAHPDWTDKQVTAEVARVIRREIERRFPGAHK